MGQVDGGNNYAITVRLENCNVTAPGNSLFYFIGIRSDFHGKPPTSTKTLYCIDAAIHLRGSEGRGGVVVNHGDGSCLD